MIILNYPGILSHQGSTTVSLETYPLYSFIIITIQLELKKTTTTKKTTMIYKGWPNVTLHMILGTKVITHTQHTNTSCRMPIVYAIVRKNHPFMLVLQAGWAFNFETFHYIFISFYNLLNNTSVLSLIINRILFSSVKSTCTIYLWS